MFVTPPAIDPPRIVAAAVISVCVSMAKEDKSVPHRPPSGGRR
jgi:hypothetical protein